MPTNQTVLIKVHKNCFNSGRIIEIFSTSNHLTWHSWSWSKIYVGVPILYPEFSKEITQWLFLKDCFDRILAHPFEGFVLLDIFNRIRRFPSFYILKIQNILKYLMQYYQYTSSYDRHLFSCGIGFVCDPMSWGSPLCS